jgi:hypothetical protein
MKLNCRCENGEIKDSNCLNRQRNRQLRKKNGSVKINHNSTSLLDIHGGNNRIIKKSRKQNIGRVFMKHKTKTHNNNSSKKHFKNDYKQKIRKGNEIRNKAVKINKFHLNKIVV